MNSSLTSSIVIAVVLLVVALMGFAGKCFSFKGSNKYSSEQLSKFARFSALGYLVMAVGCGAEAYIQYTNITGENVGMAILVAALLIGLIIVIIGKKKYLHK